MKKKQYVLPAVRILSLQPDLYFCVSITGGLEDTIDDIIDDED